ncbi:MAG: hypothetical protein GKS00_25955 [Alphaproteobacteria bacterium]|nr:hypothetical protein [Alphaproteobacteria bacterium]
MTKTLAFWVIMMLVPLVLLIVAVEGYYLYGYLSLRADYCRSFARLDDQLGWDLAPDTESCVIGRASVFGEPAFRADVHINRDGARVAARDEPTPAGGLLAIGDSWTFGYGIEGKDTFAARLTADHDRPTALFASPAYSGAQALLLGRRAAPAVRPRAIIYLEYGFWGRAVCSGDERPTAMLKPCYWVDDQGTAHLVTPPAEHVRRMAAFGMKPGGMVGAGEKTLGYFLVSRPVAKFRQALVRLGLTSGFADDFAAVAPKEQLAAIKQAHYRNLTELAASAGATLVLIDPTGVYDTMVANGTNSGSIIYLGQIRWHREVGLPLSKLPPAQARVPSDGHFGPGAHRLIAAMIDRALDQTAKK